MTATADPVALEPLDVDDLRGRVDDRLNAFVEEQRSRLLAVGVELAPVLDTLSDLLAGGKRLRAGFCYWGWRGAGAASCPQVVDAAAALELFHVAALIHDDVMDRSDRRRGLPTVHRRFAGHHRELGLRGEANRYGEGTALLLGDLCLTWSDELLSGVLLPTTTLARGRRVYELMRTQVIAGQYLDLLEQGRRRSTVEEAHRVLRYKSAKYTVEHPLLLGGALAGAPGALQDAYAAFGLPVGEAFQLRDDVLGVFGDPVRTGKPSGDDLREGKRTMLVALAAQRAGVTERTVLDAHLGDADLDDSGIDALRAVIVDTGALDEVERSIGSLVEQGLEALATADVDAGARAVLDGLAVASTRRTA